MAEPWRRLARLGEAMDGKPLEAGDVPMSQMEEHLRQTAGSGMSAMERINAARMAEGRPPAYAEQQIKD